jgi:hypothetical protein
MSTEKVPRELGCEIDVVEPGGGTSKKGGGNILTITDVDNNLPLKNCRNQVFLIVR